MPPSSRGLGQLPFTEQTGIRIPLGVLKIIVKKLTKEIVMEALQAKLMGKTLDIG